MEEKRLSPQMWFAIGAFLCIGVITFVGSLFYINSHNSHRTQMLHEAERNAASSVRDEIFDHMSPQDLQPPYPPDFRERMKRLEADMRRFSGVFRIKVYSRDGTIIFSDEKRLTGRQFMKVMRRIREGGGKVSAFETVIRAKDGSIIPVSISAAILYDEYGQEAGTVGYNKDLRESEEKFRGISSSAQDAIVMTDNERNISHWNEAAEKAFSHSSQEDLGKKLHSLIAPQKYHQAFEEGFSRFQETGEGPAVGRTLELSALRKDGTEFPIELSLSAVKLKGKWNAVGIIRDITERKLLEQELRRADKLAAVGSLTAGATHEILNPLNIIKLILYTATQDSEVPRNIAEDLRDAMRQVDRINKITTGLHLFSRKYQPERHQIHINKVVESALELVDRDLRLQNISLEARLAEGLPPVFADKDQIQQVAVNLLSNACDAMPDGGRIVLTTNALQADGEQYVELQVADTGTGIAPENTDKLFEPFFHHQARGQSYWSWSFRLQGPRGGPWGFHLGPDTPSMAGRSLSLDSTWRLNNGETSLGS